ncbi:Uncharacterized protein SCF082_LOCUS1245 [Durusdinium trenchii]|uniref:Uncharacterized protein n=1 Tax=Durusdinium trenchii TaxID=1381693 RepID=A0ABP0HCZ4_9DINO
MSVPGWEDSLLVMAFLIFTSSAFGMNLLVILIATLCNLWGPGKALRGADQAHLHQAIDVLEQAQKEAMRFFVIGLFCYFISTILVVWLFFDKMGALMTTIILILFCFMLIRQSLVIRLEPYLCQEFHVWLPSRAGLKSMLFALQLAMVQHCVCLYGGEKLLARTTFIASSNRSCHKS